MKFFSGVLVRAIIVLMLGIFLTVYPDQTSTLLVRVVGMAFMIPSLVVLLLALVTPGNSQAQPNRMQSALPVLHVGSFLFGLILFLMPNLFITITMYVLGVLIIIFAANQIINLISIRQYLPVRAVYYILPMLMMAAGIFMLVHPLEMAGSPFYILGLCCIICGVTDLINLICFRQSRCRRKGHIGQGGGNGYNPNQIK